MAKELAYMKGYECEARGHVEIMYTDPVTSKVKEKIEGNNHVFKDLVFCTDLENLMNHTPLVITDRKSTPIEEEYLMFARGHAIGFGLPGETTDNKQFKGSWVENESYRIKKLSGGIASKFTYQFYPTQALGTMGSIALTRQFHLNTADLGTPYKLAWSLPTYPDIDTGRGVCRSKEYAYGFGTGMTVSSKKIYKLKMNYPPQGAQFYDIASIVTDPTGWTYRVTRNPTNGRMYVLLLLPISPTLGRLKFYEFEDDTFTTLILSRDLDELITLTHIHEYNPIGVYNGKIILSYNQSTKLYLLAVDIQGDNHVSKDISSSVHHISSDNYRNASTLHFQTGKYSYLSIPTPYAGYNDHSRPLINLNTLSFETWYSHGNQTMAIHPYIDGTAVVGAYPSGKPLTSWGAAAVYTVPDDAPQRPPGYGMTVSYELEIKY